MTRVKSKRNERIRQTRRHILEAVRELFVNKRTVLKEPADVLFGLLSPELYLLPVRDRGRSSERQGQWAHAGSCMPQFSRALVGEERAGRR